MEVRMMTFTCNGSHICGPDTWTGRMYLVNISDRYCELIAEARHTFFSVVIGTCRSGKYLFVPSHDFGCVLRNYDEKYNRAAVRKHLGPEDSESLVALLNEFQSL